MIPLLMVLELLSINKEKLSSLLDYYRNTYTVTPEINYTVNSIDENLERIENFYKDMSGVKISHFDGVSIEFDNWRFNL